MTEIQFLHVLLERQVRISAVLARKAAEYTRGDRLSNFKRAAAMLNCTPEQACLGFWAKHVVSIMDFVKDIEHGELASEAMWDEKIGDAISYLILLEALIKDRRNSSTVNT